MFSADIHRTSESDLRLDVQGEVTDTSVTRLDSLITEAIVLRRPDMLLIDLCRVTVLGEAAVRALLAGYVTAIDYGTSYRVLHAEGPARAVLQASGMVDVLADSDDLGALLHAVVFCS